MKVEVVANAWVMISVVPIAIFLAMYQCPIILHSRQPIFQSDTDYYKHTIIN